MKKAVGFINASAARLMRFSVSSVASARQTTKSASANTCSSVAVRTPGSSMTLYGIGGQHRHAERPREPGEMLSDEAETNQAHAAP
jgi:hypothetical protein